MNRRNFLLTSALFFGGIRNFGFANPQTDFKTLKIGYLPITDHLLVIAKDFKGSNFTPIKFPSWVDLSEALRSKSIDGAFILTPLALRLKSQGLDIKAIMAAHRNGSALVVKKGFLGDSNKRDITQLKGLKIAIPSRFSTHYLLLSNLLSQANLTTDDVALIDMAPTEMLSALSSNSIDAFIVAEPFCIAAENAKLADVFILSKDILNNHICCVLTFHQQILEQQSQNITALVGDFLESANFIHNKPQEAARLSNKFLGQRVPLIENLLSQDKRVIYEHLKLTPEDISHTIKNMEDFKIAKLNITFEDFVDSHFIDLAGKA